MLQQQQQLTSLLLLIRNPLGRLCFCVLLLPLVVPWVGCEEGDSGIRRRSASSSSVNLKDYVVLNSGYQMPLRGFATFNFKATPLQIKEAVSHALKIGYRHLDCASVYQNERQVGQAIREAIEDFNISRTELFITSKLWNTHHHPDDVEPAFRKSIHDLGLDYLDLYLIHFPVAFENGNIPFPHSPDGKTKLGDVHPKTTWTAMEKLLELPDFPLKSIGLANFNAAQVRDILDNGKVVPAVNQVEAHAYFHQKKLKRFLDEFNITMVASSPLGSPNRPWAKPKDPKLIKDKTLTMIGFKHGRKTAAQIALKYLIQQQIPVITFSSQPDRIKENFDIFDFTLTSTDLKQIDKLGKNPKFNSSVNFAHYSKVYGHSPYFPFHEEL